MDPRSLRRGVALSAGLDDRDGQVVLDVGVHPCEGELDGQHRPVVSALEQGGPRSGHSVRIRVVRLDPQRRERHVELFHERRVHEDRSTVEPSGNGLGHGQVHPVEHRRAVAGRQLVVDPAEASDDALHR